MYPSGNRYTKEHEWVHVEGDIATTGITSFAAQELGEIVYVDQPEVGRVIAAGDELGSIESVKAVAEFYSAVSGEVVETNPAIQEDPALLNSDPHGEGWIVKIRLSNAAELDGLMDAEAYSDFAQD